LNLSIHFNHHALFDIKLILCKAVYKAFTSTGFLFEYKKTLPSRLLIEITIALSGGININA